MVFAVDINEGRLRILKETAVLQNVDKVITIINADLRALQVNYYSLKKEITFLFGTRNV